MVSVIAGRNKDLVILEDEIRASSDEVIIMTDDGNFVEVQGTGEHGTFTQEQLLELLALGRKAAGELKQLQQAALDGLELS